MESYVTYIKEIRKTALIITSIMRISSQTLEIVLCRHKYEQTPADQLFCNKC
jgi:hypothetical protein